MIDTLQTLNIEFLMLQVLNYSDICTVCVKNSLKSKFLEMLSNGLLVPRNLCSEKKHILNLCFEENSYLVLALFCYFQSTALFMSIISYVLLNT